MGAPNRTQGISFHTVKWTLLAESLTTLPLSCSHPTQQPAELLMGCARRIKCSCLTSLLQRFLATRQVGRGHTMLASEPPQDTALTFVSFGTWGARWTWRARVEGFCKEGDSDGVDEVLFLKKQQLAQNRAHCRCSAMGMTL